MSDIELCFYSEDEDIYYIEDDIVRQAEFYTDIYLEGYKRIRRLHWRHNERDNIKRGLMAQLIFEEILRQYEIPYIPDRPILDNFKLRKKRYDFNVPGIGTIEIKSVREGRKYILVKKREWTDADYLVGIMIADDFSTARMLGYLHGGDVEKMPDGGRLCPYAPCWKIDVFRLRDWKELLEKLRKISLG